LIVSFIDEMVAAGRAVESTCRVLTDLGCKVAARTYRAWKAGLRAGYRAVADRHHHDALVMNAIETLCWSTDAHTEVRRPAPESLYGQRKMTAALRRSQLPGTDRVAFCTVDRAMKALGRDGVRRHKGGALTSVRGHADSSPVLGKRDDPEPWRGRTTRRSFVGKLSTCTSPRLVQRCAGSQLTWVSSAAR
jgi:hypothetical protein